VTRRDELLLDPVTVRALVCDMDGVVTDTAGHHARAWQTTFDAFLDARRRHGARRGEDLRPFDADAEYRAYVDGRPRYEGVRAFLAARGIELPEGDPDDPPDRQSVHALGNRKNACYLRSIREHGVTPFEDAVELLRRARAAGLGTAVFSASRNALEVLRAGGVLDLFDVRVDGAVAATRGLAGKPAPDVLLAAAASLQVAPQRAAVLEDAAAGIEAARRGGFGWVIGIARGGAREDLAAAGADAVLDSPRRIRFETKRGVERSIASLPCALDHVDAIRARADAREIVTLLDFDGTLAPIVPRPGDAALPRATRELLERLVTRHLIAIVSGRGLDDVRARVGIEGLYYAGDHGFALAGPGGTRQEYAGAASLVPEVAAAADALERRLRGEADVEIERKRFSVAVHFRRAPEREDDVREALEAECKRRDGLRIGMGRMVLELRPDLEWDKGRALEWIDEALGLEASRRMRLYVGDDVTDEDAFRALGDDGVGVLVRGRGDGRSLADYALDDVDAVRAFLARLLDDEAEAR